MAGYDDAVRQANEEIIREEDEVNRLNKQYVDLYDESRRLFDSAMQAAKDGRYGDMVDDFRESENKQQEGEEVERRNALLISALRVRISGKKEIYIILLKNKPQ